MSDTLLETLETALELSEIITNIRNSDLPEAEQNELIDYYLGE